MDSSNYFAALDLWLRRKGYSKLPEFLPTRDEAASGLYYFMPIGNSIRLLRLINAEGFSAAQISADITAEFANLENFRAERGLQFVWEMPVYVFSQPVDWKIVEFISGSQKLSALSRCGILPRLVDLSETVSYSQKRVSSGEFAGLLGQDSLLQYPALAAHAMDKSTGRDGSELESSRASRWKLPVVTYSLIFICVALAILTGFSTKIQIIVRFGAKVNELIAQGQYWRLITSVFLHFGILHLAFNMLFLYNLGPGLEYLFGRWRYAAIYLAAGIMGSIASFALNPGISVGASGALFGLIGAYIYFWQRKPVIGKRIGTEMITLLVFNVIFGLMNPSVDNWAHFGGFAGGLLASNTLGLPGEQKIGLRQGISLVIYGCLIALGLEYGLHSL